MTPSCFKVNSVHNSLKTVHNSLKILSYRLIIFLEGGSNNNRNIPDPRIAILGNVNKLRKRDEYSADRVFVEKLLIWVVAGCLEPRLSPG